MLVCFLGLPGVAAAQQAETIEYYGTDAIGSIRIVWDASGNVTARQDFTPFGEPVLQQGTAIPKEGFVGNETDAETNQDYFHARMFEARTGRFTRPDAIQDGVGEPQRWNRYAYAVDNPLRFADALGLNADPDCDPAATYCAHVYGPEPDASFWIEMDLLGLGDGGGIGSGGGSSSSDDQDGRERGGGATTTTPPTSPPTNPPTDPPPTNPPTNPPAASAPPVGSSWWSTTRACYGKYNFGATMGGFFGSDAQTVADFIQVGSTASFGADMTATYRKGGGLLGTTNPYASGINWAFRSVGRALNLAPTTIKTLTTIGDSVTPALAVTAVGTGAYNLSTLAQCGLGVMN